MFVVLFLLELHPDGVPLVLGQRLLVLAAQQRVVLVHGVHGVQRAGCTDGVPRHAQQRHVAHARRHAARHARARLVVQVQLSEFGAVVVSVDLLLVDDAAGDGLLRHRALVYLLLHYP